MAATQIRSQKPGLWPHNGQTARFSQKSLCVDFTLVNMDFGFVDSKLRHLFNSQPWIRVCVCAFFPFLNRNVKPSLNIIVKESGKNRTLHVNKLGKE